MKKLLLLLIVFSVYISNAQFYQFSQSSGAYSNISGGTILINNNWDHFAQSFKTPFTWRLFTSNITDSIEVDNDGSLYFNNINNGYFNIFNVILNSRGNGLSPVSYVVTGSAPNRIIKIEFNNVGFYADAPGFMDYMNFQCWVYETSYIIEYRYGPNSVKTSSYAPNPGPLVVLADPLAAQANFIVLEGDPSNPKVTIKDFATSGALNSAPVNGTIYRFTPSQFPTGITPQKFTSVNITTHKMIIPVNLDVEQISVINANGQTVLQASSAADIDLQDLPHGLYLVNLKTGSGILNQKLVW